ncbi:hypothetical protein FQN54_003676 [Arachnomyces sp. PD_36]|nr:hypothetical protein FQN54_003676 [Arachnomyces sp. PD_36]
MLTPLSERIAAAACPLPPLSTKSFGSYFDSYADNDVVLLGDGTHGTSEFYRARMEITKHLIKHHGFNIVAAEADWPDAERVDRYVRQRPAIPVKSEEEKEEPFQRFPTWMWRNKEMQFLAEWMRNHNAKLDPEKRVGFFGLDIFSMGTSIRAVTDYLDGVDPNMANIARRRYGCLQPWVEDPAQYGLLASNPDVNMGRCEAKVVRMLHDLLKKRIEYINAHSDGDEFHSAEQNARVVAHSEAYYRAMFYSSPSSWSLRDTHMCDTLQRLLETRPKGSKVVVWAHNSHVGDARYTSMGRRGGEVNLGQLVREKFGRDNVALLGCGTNSGTVAAAHDWDEDMEIMEIQPSRKDSWEYIAHQTGIRSFVLDLREGRAHPEIRQAMAKETNRLERFIGVIYRPETERISHYSVASLADQFDAYIWFDETEAVQALEKIQPRTVLSNVETYPFGL